MHIYEFNYPGMIIILSDKDTAWAIKGLIDDIESSFTEAAVALNLFESERLRPHEELHNNDLQKSADPEFLMKNWEEERNKRIELTTKYQAQFISEGKDPYSYEQSMNIHELIETALKHEKWKSGVFPRSYEHKIIFIYAKAFVSALDMVGKLLHFLWKDYKNILPQGVTDQKDKFFQLLPQLKGVRDSLQHHEHRGRGLDKNGQSLDIQPGSKGGINIIGNKSLVLNHLNGNKFGTTINDGQFVEVEISDQTMKPVQQCIQGIIDSFSWEGIGSCRPN